MKKIMFAIITILIINKGFSQAKIANQTTLDSISKIVIHYLQAKQADSLYALAGEHFKSQLTEENFKSIANNQVFPLNDFQQITFISTENSVNSYKVDGTPELKLLISLDGKNKLETFLIQPFNN
ncbi:MAG: hypothetical protein ABI683_12475 [Ginsengibacter sp.]